MPADMPVGVVAVGSSRLTVAEAAALRLLRTRRLYVVPRNAWGSLRVLEGLAVMRLTAQCGHLFYAVPAGDHLVSLVPPINDDIFGGNA